MSSSDGDSSAYEHNLPSNDTDDDVRDSQNEWRVMLPPLRKPTEHAVLDDLRRAVHFLAQIAVKQLTSAHAASALMRLVRLYHHFRPF